MMALLLEAALASATAAVVAGSLIFVASRVPGTKVIVVTGIALAAGYAGAHIVLLGAPPFPPRESGQWMLLGLLACGAAGLLQSFAPPLWRWAIYGLLAVAALSVQLLSKFQYAWGPWESVVWVAALALACLVLLQAHLELGKSIPQAAYFFMAASFTGLLAAAIGLSGSASIAFLIGAMGAALGVTFLITLIAKGRLASPSCALLLAFFQVSAVLNAHFYSYLSAWPSILLLASPALGMAALRLPIGRGRIYAAFAGTLIPAILAVVLTIPSPSADGAQDYY